jgi:hypothetical protein
MCCVLACGALTAAQEVSDEALGSDNDGCCDVSSTGSSRRPHEGGQTYHLTKGDVITIPAGTPHWFKEVPTQTIAYYAVNTEP